ncbi:MAG TPA: M1 family aminopeptidase [Blastocatellia bacterium]|nr:M1 family aminopeptidase [Blastocatellia bacterium]HMY71441.1 M1 family aminopeptidase [Blastocatellia bacterium]HMZ17701.1 M1 family aminopeptidase [Blastocatellia bacterium]HNG33239.1 M1 family aminopeptidase [Blastocatellia bacterium]
MNTNDKLIHPALLDPRLWADANLYDAVINIDRDEIEGEDHYTPDRKFALRHLKLDLHVNDERQSVEGTATFTLSPLNDGLSHIELDIAEMRIADVKLLNVEERGTGDLIRSARQLTKRLEFETHPQKLVIELDRGYARNEQLTIAIAYSCSPRKGLYFVKPDEAYPDKPRQIWSQGQNEDAHWWFPCQDVTHQKMTTEMIVTVNAKYFALSNGELIGTHDDHQNGTRTFHWSQSQPHPAYLVTLVVGDYERIEERYESLPVDYYVYKNRKEAGYKLFANTPKMIPFFERKYGYAYPYPKYSQILVDDFLFGAMENTSATTMTDRCVLDAQAEQDINYDDIVAHELAHQWWGDLVTCKDWTQIWLNESFATYSEYLWREHSCGRDEARFVIFQDFLTYLREDFTSHRRPIVCRKYRFSEDVMDRHAYEKGACVLDMLRWELGDEAFFRSLSHHLKKFEFGVAETNDFRVSIEEATGQNLHWFFDQWLHGAGYPELEVSYEWQRDRKMLRIAVKQTQENEEDQTPVFRFSADIEIATVEAEEVIETERRQTFRVTVEREEQEFYFPCEAKPRMVLFDKGHRIFKLMSFPKSAQELTFQLTKAEDVMDRLRAARELSQFNGEEVIQTLAECLRGQDFYAVRMAAAISLGEIGGDSARNVLVEAYRSLPNSRVRRACLWGIGKLKDDAAVELLREALTKDDSYFAAVAAARALANTGGDKAYDALVNSLGRSSWQEVIAASIFHGFAHAKEKRAVDPAIEHSKYGKPVPIRIAAIGCLAVLGKELNKDKKADRIVDHLIELTKDKNIRARVSAIRALGKVGNARALPALREAKQRECLEQLIGAALDAIKSLEE